MAEAESSASKTKVVYASRRAAVIRSPFKKIGNVRNWKNMQILAKLALKGESDKVSAKQLAEYVFYLFGKVRLMSVQVEVLKHKLRDTGADMRSHSPRPDSPDRTTDTPTQNLELTQLVDAATSAVERVKEGEIPTQDNSFKPKRMETRPRSPTGLSSSSSTTLHRPEALRQKTASSASALTLEEPKTAVQEGRKPSSALTLEEAKAAVQAGRKRTESPTPSFNPFAKPK
jgi:hypothetical protein